MKTQDFKLTRYSSDTADEIYSELSGYDTATLGTLGPDMAPHLTAVYFKIDDNFVIRFATKSGTLKHQNIQRNNRIQLLVYDKKKQITTQVSGRAFEITDGLLRTKVVNNLYSISNKNNYNSPPISKLYVGDYVAYRVEPVEIKMTAFLKKKNGWPDMSKKLTF